MPVPDGSDLDRLGLASPAAIEQLPFSTEPSGEAAEFPGYDWLTSLSFPEASSEQWGLCGSREPQS
jgi:hypothetical protein